MDKLFKECENMFMPEPLVDGRLNVGPVEQIKFGPSDSDRRRDTNVYEQDYVRNEMKKYANYQAMPMNEVRVRNMNFDGFLMVQFIPE